MRWIFSFFALGFLWGNPFAQHSLTPVVIASSGGYSTSPSGSVSMTSGELVVETVTAGGSGYIITQGFQQPEKATVGIEEEKQAFQATIFPNPVQDILQVELEIIHTGEITFQWFDLSGKMVQNASPQYHPGGKFLYQLNAASLAAGAYILTISIEGFPQTKTFKVIKQH